MSVLDFAAIAKKRPERSLLESRSKTGGRNALGRRTARHRGGGHKQLYRIIDFKRRKDGIPGKVAAVEYDPNRTSHIALVSYVDGEKRYILAPLGLKIGDTILSGPEADIKPGNSLPLSNIPLGTLVHNVELRPGRGGQLGRSAGSSIQLMAKEGSSALLKMPSGELRLVQGSCRATIGQVGNIDQANLSLGKAGRARWLGWRSAVRGTAMNPVDHPHGGGEGKSKGNHPVSPWGQPAKGYRTRTNKRTDKYIVKRRG